MSLKSATALDKYSARGSFRVGREELTRRICRNTKAFAVPANTLVVAIRWASTPGALGRPSKRVEIWGVRRR